MPLQVELVSPERILYEGEADMVVCRVADGEIAFLPGHVPFVGTLAISILRVLLPDSGEVVAAVHGGFVQVAHDKVTVLSDVAELGGDVDQARARLAQEHAEELVRANADDEEAQAALDRAGIRLEAADMAAGKITAH
jgi:F-type H+-transporting ATPase subunit epsilon